MAAPSKSWVVISDAMVDADSPLDTTLMTGIRDDLVHLEEWLGMSYTAAQDHDHDGVNSKVFTIPAAFITLTMLNLTQGEYSSTASGTHYVTVHENAHYPHFRFNNTDTVSLNCSYSSSTINTDHRVVTMTKSGGSATAWVRWKYHTN